ncbi:MAG TPA: hypothetical protein VE198_15550 [Actinoallomurus sp.]|jgi:hypothetical protein|nr:hypothetical protein [Actinoallomurus sp.]
MAARRDILETLRDEIRSRLEGRGGCDNEDHHGVTDRELPGLARELRLLLSELDGLPSEKKDAPADEIAERREERRRKAAGE